MEEQQFASPLLGESHQEPQLCVRYPQVQHRGRMSVSGGADLHGFLLHFRSQIR